MQLNVSASAGFRELTSEELHAVTGGTNPIEHSHNMDAASASESALQITNRIQGISASENYEYGAMIVANANGTADAVRYSALFVNPGVFAPWSCAIIFLQLDVSFHRQKRTPAR